MAGATKKNQITLFLNLKGNREVNRQLRDAEKHIGKMGAAIARAGAQGTVMNRTFTAMTAGVGKFITFAKLSVTTMTRFITVGTAMAGVIGGIGFKLANTAAEAAESRSLFEQAFQGDALISMDANVKKLVRTLGLSRTELHQSASLMAVFGQKAGLAGNDLSTFADKLLWVGADLTASFNSSFEEAMLAIRSGLSGETEPLKKFGIVMTEADLAAQSAALGFSKAYKEMDQGEKVLVRAAFIERNLGFARGQAIREAQNYGTVMRGLAGTAKTWAEDIGTPLMEPFKTAAVVLLDFGDRVAPKVANWLERMLPPADQLAGGLTSLGTTVEHVMDVFMEQGLMGGIEHFFGPQTAEIIRDVSASLKAAGQVAMEFGRGIIDALAPDGGAADNLTGPLDIIRTTLEWLANHGDVVRELGTAFINLAGPVMLVSGGFTLFSKGVTSAMAAKKLFGGLADEAATVAGKVSRLNRVMKVGLWRKGIKLGDGKAGTRLFDGLKAGAKRAGKNASTNFWWQFQLTSRSAKNGAANLLGAPGRMKAGAINAGKRMGGAFTKGFGMLKNPKALMGFFKALNPVALINRFGTALKVVFTLMRANPIGILVTAGIALVGAFVAMYNTSEKLRNTLDGAWAAIKSAGVAVWEALGAAMNWLWENVAQPFMAWWETDGGPMMSTAAQVAGDILADVLNSIGGGLKWLWENVAQPAFVWFRDTGWPMMQEAIEKAKPIIQPIIDGFGNGLEAIKNFGKQAMDVILDFSNKVGGWFEKAWRSSQKWIDHLREGLESFNNSPVQRTSPHSISAAQDFTRTQMEIAGRRAMGGPVKANRPYLVGEMGRELFIPKTPGIIVPNHRLEPNRMPAPQGRGGVTISVTLRDVTVGGVSSPQDADRAARQLANKVTDQVVRNLRIAEEVG